MGAEPHVAPHQQNFRKLQRTGALQDASAASRPIASACALSIALLLLLASAAQATITINISSGHLQGSISGVLLPAGTLIELVNLGSDGVFNPIIPGTGQSNWVGGDDSLVSVQYTSNERVEDFPSSAAFDLAYGTDTPGVLDRSFTFALGAIPAGAKLGIRWFPGLQATQFTSLTGPAIGQAYGQFTRQTTPRANNTVWTVPLTDGSIVTFDPLLTNSYLNGGFANDSGAGGDPDSLGVASFTVVPEPSAAGLLALAALGLAGRRFRSKATAHFCLPDNASALRSPPLGCLRTASALGIFWTYLTSGAALVLANGRCGRPRDCLL